MFVQLEIGNNLEKTPYKDIDIKFPQSFTKVPEEIPSGIIVIATVEVEDFDSKDRFSVNVANITNSGFIARVARLDGDGWNTNLKLNYMANTTTIFSKGV